MNDTPYNKDFGSYYYELNDYYNNKGEKGKIMINDNNLKNLLVINCRIIFYPLPPTIALLTNTCGAPSLTGTS